MSRLEANLEILENLAIYFRNHPDMRFNQGLTHILDLKDLSSEEFYEESENTLLLIYTKLSQYCLINRYVKSHIQL